MSQLNQADQKLSSFLERLLDQDDASGAHLSFCSAGSRLKYKTEKCRYWAAHGTCPFRESCAFAHGNTELRERRHLPRNYKTRTCVNFEEQGYCLYGDRCQFVHGKPAQCRIGRGTRRSSFETLLGSVTQDLGELAACGRLRVFREMESDDSLSDQFSAVDWKWPGCKKRLYSVTIH